MSELFYDMVLYILAHNVIIKSCPTVPEGHCPTLFNTLS